MDIVLIIKNKTGHNSDKNNYNCNIYIGYILLINLAFDFKVLTEETTQYNFYEQPNIFSSYILNVT